MAGMEEEKKAEESTAEEKAPEGKPVP